MPTNNESSKVKETDRSMNEGERKGMEIRIKIDIFHILKMHTYTHKHRQPTHRKITTHVLKDQHQTINNNNRSNNIAYTHIVDITYTFIQWGDALLVAAAAKQQRSSG